MQKKVVAQPKPYTVMVLECPHCGEEMYLIYSCEHCGAEGAMHFKEHLHFNKKELEAFYDEKNGEIRGDVRSILRSDEKDADADGPVASDIEPFKEDDMAQDFSLDEL